MLRWPFAGALVALLTDFGDFFLMDWLGGIFDYQRFDKLCDLAYMATYAIVAVRWKVIDRKLQAAIAPPSEGPAILSNRGRQTGALAATR